MVRECSLRLALLVFTGVLATSTLGAISFAESFDKPLQETKIDLGPSPSQSPNSGMRVQLSCYYFPDFMVKELNDMGRKGTRWVAVAPVFSGHVPACQRLHESEDRFIAKEWWSFIGAKGPLLFLEAADGMDGGMPFRIFDWKTGKKIFEDSKSLDVEFTRTPDGTMSLRYLRVVAGDCSIPKGGASCWNKLRKQFELALLTMPKCTGYDGEVPVPAQEEATESALTFPVVVKLFPRPSIKAVPGPLACMPTN